MQQRYYTLSDMKCLFETLKSFKKSDETKGITRLAYSTEDEAAHQFMIKTMKAHGLTVRVDAIGNVFARLQGKNSQLSAVGTGSHLDTVPEGGAYDGTLGVITGLYALMQFKSGELLRDLELVIFRAEESSRFGFSCIGSKVMTGNLDIEHWKENVDDEGKNFFDIIDELGYSSEKIDTCVLPDNYFSAFVELHVEQGARLEKESLEVGVVNGIAAPTRFEVVVKGQADHSGTTPMNQRQDALVASAGIIRKINHAACRESYLGTVATVGKMEVHPNSMNVIPGRVNFYVDIRGLEKASIARIVDILHEAILVAEADNDVTIILREISSEEPVKLDESICGVIANQCKKSNVSYMNMSSGAGHDTMYIAKKYPAAMIFTPSRHGISHHHDEFTCFSNIEVAATLLVDTLKDLGNRQ